MGAARKDITISQGIDFYYAFLIKNEDGSPFDATGYTLAAKVRATPESPTVLLAFTCSLTVPASGGPAVIASPAATNSAAPRGIFHWDCIITSSSAPDIKLLKGKATIEATASS